ncbi:NUDIX hydrolase domain-like protein [Xylaria bambusicola]|uniref:NUDIX hydrolase domain-like protein n=1 Tax=Xylaria bambusicola TaxID=326684 RepID=UPI0020085C99|nr:NUDIX hydrolase domain-like protein [Xylaria bambusicola]KAI0515379.1 NUDIX hydrolase domain-like protein [Xylaria bambusicola]
MSQDQQNLSNLDLVEAVDSWPYFSKDPEAYRRHTQDCHYFLVEGYDEPVGYIHNDFVARIDWTECWKIDPERRFLSLKTGGPPSINDFETRTRLMQETLEQGQSPKKVLSLKYWANELFPLYTSSGEHVLDMDGCGVDTFGILWVPRRAFTKMSFPGKLDNTIGGSLASRERTIDGIVRGCEEDLCLDPTYMRANIKQCGTNLFQLTMTDSLEVGRQHQVQHLYEIELSQDIVPRIGDGKVGSIELLTIDQVQEALKRGEFKLTCNLTYMAFFIRDGYIDAENESHLVEICSRLNR